jgi:putative hemolysin
VVDDAASGAVVGTYRIQTAAMAAAGAGFYSAGEFDLSALPPTLVDEAVEVGRACIDAEHRNRQVLFLLWQGLARYLVHNRKRYLFGCCSLTSQDPREAHALDAQLAAAGRVHPTLAVPVLPPLACPAVVDDGTPLPRVDVPTLFRTYLRYGARVCSAPAIDREFGTVDWLVLLDIDALDARSRALFFGA